MSINNGAGAPLRTNQAFLSNMKKVMPQSLKWQPVASLDDEEKQIFIQAQGFSQLHKDLVQLSNQIAHQNQPPSYSEVTPQP